ncbi:hypothetical protein [Leucobacter sp. M11]|uniref:hypothetical protein n=1 Tax=Leucobacter sp. M11 TaxID=2993565 RepID=UPI002D7EEEC0|nr:hypothetical protein [Leucobacter sp. M11]MEB4614212.1 hypothetical protein [Leucobacter sp. M11]
MIEILRNVFLVLHFVGFAVIIGGVLAQIPAMKVGAAKVKAGVLHGGWLMLATGLALVGMMYAAGNGDAVNNAKIGVKLIVLLAVVVIALMNKKKDRVATWVLPTIGGLTVLNIVLAVFW